MKKQWFYIRAKWMLALGLTRLVAFALAVANIPAGLESASALNFK